MSDIKMDFISERSYSNRRKSSRKSGRDKTSESQRYESLLTPEYDDGYGIERDSLETSKSSGYG